MTTEVAMHRTQGQLAMQPQMHVAEAPPRPIGRAYQPPLFPGASNVIPIESYVPVEPRRTQRADGAQPKTRAPRRSRVPEEQGSLDFLAPLPPKPRTLGTTVEAVIFCDAPVAVWLHRAVAAAIDWSIVLIAYGIFLFTFHQMGGEFAFDNRTNLGIFAAVLPLLGFVYGMVWACAGAETVGMQATRLKLLTFEGFPPEKRQRMFRVLGSALSLCTVIGSMWSLVDEEGLGWQDHISRTFPSPREAENLTLVRK